MMFTWYGEWLAPLLATSGKNAAAISSLHTQTEAVLVNPLSVVRLECSFHCLILFFIVNLFVPFIQSYRFNAATFAENDCKISEFREIDKRKNQKTPSFFVILMIFRNFDLAKGGIFTFSFSPFTFFHYLCIRFWKEL